MLALASVFCRRKQLFFKWVGVLGHPRHGGAVYRKVATAGVRKQGPFSSQHSAPGLAASHAAPCLARLL